MNSKSSGVPIEGSRLIVALDVCSMQAAKELATKLDPKICRLKIGKELFTACGPAVVEEVQKSGFDVFLDLKFHDIPNTTAGAVREAARLGVWMLNVHASGGIEMMLAAKETLAGFSNPPILIAVTVLTSMDKKSLAAVGISREPEEQVKLLSLVARESGLSGVVSSAREAAAIKDLCGQDFLTVTPGIRPANSANNDQKRTMTPAEAVQNGSDFLVIGRPITAAEDPAMTALRIYEDIREC